MTEYDALLAAVLAAPADDVPRLVFADWLDEHGSPARAEFIRVQCHEAKLSVTHDAECRLCCAPRAYSDCPLRPLWSVERYWVETNRRQLREEWPGWKPDVWLARQLGPWLEPAGSLVAYRRGFVEEVRIDLADYFGDERPCPRADEAVMDPTTGVYECCRECDYTGVIGSEGVAADLFRRHPITHVAPTGREPHESVFTNTPRSCRWMWVWNDRNWLEEPSSLPLDLFNLLPRGRDGGGHGPDWAGYPSPADALAALSVACVTYGRDLAGLPKLEPEPAT